MNSAYIWSFAQQLIICISIRIINFSISQNHRHQSVSGGRPIVRHFCCIVPRQYYPVSPSSFRSRPDGSWALSNWWNWKSSQRSSKEVKAIYLLSFSLKEAKWTQYTWHFHFHFHAVVHQIAAKSCQYLNDQMSRWTGGKMSHPCQWVG